MAAPSSTSNSDAAPPADAAGKSAPKSRPLPKGYPWALTWALVIVAAVEVGMRQLPRDTLLPYRVDVNVEYESLARYLEDEPLADVCIIGSSRSRDGLLAPVLAETVERETGQPLCVSNYATTAARAAENATVVQALLRQGTPRLIVYGVSPRQFAERRQLEQSAALWDASDWWSAWRRDPQLAIDYWPVMAQNELAQWSWLFRYRRRPTCLAYDFYESLRMLRQWPSWEACVHSRVFPLPYRCEGSGVTSEPAPNEVSLVNRPVTVARVESFLDRVMVDGQYQVRGSQADYLRSMLATCRDAGVPVLLVEIPVADILRAHYPPNVYDDFYAVMAEIAGETGVRFIPVSELGLTFTDEDFLEQSHLNVRGGHRLTERVTELAIVEMLQSHRHEPRDSKP